MGSGIMIAGMTLYQIGWYFVMYSFLGWVVEVAYHAVVRFTASECCSFLA